MMGDIAFIFKFPPSEIKELTIEEILYWHNQAIEKSKLFPILT